MTKQHSALFEAARIGQLELANRIVMAPMTRARANGDTAVPIPETAIYCGQRASAGLNISEGVVISPETMGYVNVPGIYNPEQVKAWREVTNAVHAKGGKIFAQSGTSAASRTPTCSAVSFRSRPLRSTRTTSPSLRAVRRTR